MNLLSFIKKYWLNCLGVLIVLIGIAIELYIGIKQYNSKLLFTVTDASKKCLSNSLNVYSNNKYAIIKGAVPEGESNLLKTGKYDYDIDKLIASFNDDACDMENYFNYRVTLESGESYCISMMANTELNKFLESLKEENLFWCS